MNQTGDSPSRHPEPSPKEMRAALKWLLAAILLVLVTAGVACEYSPYRQCSPLSGPIQVPAQTCHLTMFTSPGKSSVGIWTQCDNHVPDRVTISWMPPPGATNVQVHPPPTSIEPDGTHVWELPVDYDGNAKPIVLTYDRPEEVSQTVDTAVAQRPDTGEQVASSLARPQGPAPPRSAPPAASGPPAPSRGTGRPQDDYFAWRVRIDVLSEETLTTDLCQDVLDFLQEGTSFVAFRFPLQPVDLPPTADYTLPIVFRGAYSPTLGLHDLRTGTNIITIPLEYKPRHFTFLENELPAASGERWLALGARIAPRVTCPAGLQLDRVFYEAYGTGYLDLGGEPDTCAGCTLPLYYCYEGQEAPLMTSFLSRSLGGAASLTSYQGWGITCLGPQPLKLQEPTVAPISLILSATGWVTYTQAISLWHRVSNNTMSPLTVTLAHTSSLGLTWGIYSGTKQRPDIPLVPITGPIQLAPVMSYPQNQRNFWLIANVPAGAEAGADTVYITATAALSPTFSTWVTDLVWVGDWVAPPLRASPTATSTATATSRPTSTPTATSTPRVTATATPTADRFWLPLVLRRDKD